MEEAQLFQILKNKLFPDLLKAKNQMSRWDCYSPLKKYRIELKCRKAHYPTLLLEKKKYDAMILECSKHNDIPLYINSTPKGIFIFNLLKITPIWEINSKNPASTHFGNYDKVPKEVCYLNIAEAKMLKFS
jgi:hypothetical protein